MNRLLPLLSIAILFALSFTPTQGQDLQVYLTASSEVLGPGNRTTYTLMVANEGSNDLSNVSVALQLPAFINRISFPPPGFSCSVGCDANEPATWNVGTLAPGRSRAAPFTVQIQASAPDSTITMTALASATGSSDASTSLDIEIDPTPLLRLSVAPGPGPAEPGEPLTYTLSYGNVGSTSPTGVVLRMAVPEGTTFASATDGGTASGGIVTWNVGVLGAGQSGEVQLAVNVDGGLGDGDALVARAEIDPTDPNEFVVGSSAVTSVRSGEPLQIAYTVSQTAQAASGALDYTLVATNTGPVDLNNVAVRLLLPGSISRIGFPPPGFSCSVGCDANEVATWNVGSLAPGQSRTAVYRVFLSGAAPQGEILRSVLVASGAGSGEVTGALDLAVDPTPLLRLSVAPGAGPAEPGEPLTYTLSYGNVGSTSPTGVVLRMAVPEGTTFASATGGGTLNGDVVTWNVGVLGAGAGEQVQVTVDVNGGLAQGELVRARATINSGISSEAVIRSLAATPVGPPTPLRVAYAVSQTAQAASGALDYTLVATNTGPVDLNNVAVRLLLPGSISRIGFPPPGFSCSVGCDANEVATWNVGSLAPGQSRTAVYRVFLSGAAPQGEILRSVLVASGAGSGEVTGALDLAVDPTPLLRLSVAPGAGPAEPGEPLTYTLSYGNVGSTSPTGVVLRMAVPEGTTFASATGGGTLSGGIVIWNVGVVGPGQGNQVKLTVDVNGGLSEGSILTTLAEIESGIGTEYVVRSLTAFPVRGNVPLHIRYTANKNDAEPADTVAYTLVATNNGPADLNNVSARVLLPASIGRLSPTPPGFSCSVGCDANEVATWNVGTLIPGQSATVSFDAVLFSSAQRGGLLSSPVRATATGSNEAIDWNNVFVGDEVSIGPVVSITLAPLNAPIVIGAGGGTFRYRATLTNHSATSQTVEAWAEAVLPNGNVFGPVFGPQTLTLGPGQTLGPVTLEQAVPGAAPAGSYLYRANLGTFPSNVIASDDFPVEKSGASSREADHTVDGWAVEQVDGPTLLTGASHAIQTAATRSEAYTLDVQAYPTPFSGTTTFTLSLPAEGEVRLVVYDALGRTVGTLAEGPKPAGHHDLQWDASGLPSGVYFYRLDAAQGSRTGSLVKVN